MTARTAQQNQFVAFGAEGEFQPFRFGASPGDQARRAAAARIARIRALRAAQVAQAAKIEAAKAETARIVADRQAAYAAASGQAESPFVVRRPVKLRFATAA